MIQCITTAVVIDGTLDKESTSSIDIFDAFRLAKFYHFENRVRQLITHLIYINYYNAAMTNILTPFMSLLIMIVLFI